MARRSLVVVANRLPVDEMVLPDGTVEWSPQPRRPGQRPAPGPARPPVDLDRLGRRPRLDALRARFRRHPHAGGAAVGVRL